MDFQDIATSKEHSAKATSDEHNPSSSSVSHQSHSWQRLTLDTWLPEFLAIIISVAWLAAILATLLCFNLKSTPHLPYGVKLNAIVSILATASRSMLIYTVATSISQLKWCWYVHQKRKVQDMQTFDDASRGPWGAVAIISLLRLRPIASTFGALITILILGFEPSVQQIITYPSRVVVGGQDFVASAKRAPVFMFDADSNEWLTAIDTGDSDLPSAREHTCTYDRITWGWKIATRPQSLAYLHTVFVMVL